MKAMILAAGRGERLKPLTDTMPKPLVPVDNRRLIEHNIIQLKKSGITHLVINVCYLAQQITDYLGDGSRYGIHIEYSHEEGSCLGTGGGIYKALSLLGNAPFWIVSADIWCDFQFTPMQLSHNTLAHLIMVPNPDFHPQGDYSISADGRLNFDEPKLTYSGIALIDPKLFNNCQTQAFSLSPIIDQAAQNHAISAELYSGRWFNIGTEEQLHLLQNVLAHCKE